MAKQRRARTARRAASRNAPTLAERPLTLLSELGLVTWPDGQLHHAGRQHRARVRHQQFSLGTETRDSADFPFLTPLHPGIGNSLNAVSWGFGRIDIILGNGNSLETTGPDSSSVTPAPLHECVNLQLTFFGTPTDPPRRTRAAAPSPNLLWIADRRSS
jgi:hypothetical protein